jgi:hypothetical protein
MESVEARGLVTAAVTLGFLYFLKPSGQFYEGKARPFSLWSGEPEATPFPPFFVAGLMGFLSVTLI